MTDTTRNVPIPSAQRNLSCKPSFKRGLLALAMVGGTSTLMAQATSVGVRTFNLSGFATGGITNTDYGQKDSGLTFGTDLTRYFHLVQPSFELRSTMTSGDKVREHTYNGGLKLEKAFGRVHPYGDFLYGYGVISFPKSVVYPWDNSAVKTFGGGVEYQVSRSFLVKADMQMQSWKTSVKDPSFQPTLATVGFTYRPFHRDVIR